MTKLLIAATLLLGAAFAHADVIYVLDLGPCTYVTGTGYSDVYVNLGALMDPKKRPIELSPGEVKDTSIDFLERLSEQSVRDFEKYCDELVHKSN